MCPHTIDITTLLYFSAYIWQFQSVSRSLELHCVIELPVYSGAYQILPHYNLSVCWVYPISQWHTLYCPSILYFLFSFKLSLGYWALCWTKTWTYRATWLTQVEEQVPSPGPNFRLRLFINPLQTSKKGLFLSIPAIQQWQLSKVCFLWRCPPPIKDGGHLHKNTH